MTVLEYRVRSAGRAPSGAALGRVRHAAIRAAQGVSVVVTDDRAGYLALVATSASAEGVAFTVRHSSGFLRVALAAGECRRLGLPPLAAASDSEVEAMAVSVDAAEGVTTGISAHDRARTIRLLGTASTRPDDLSRPGHVVPVRIDEDGLGGRVALPEALAELAAIGGASPAAAYAELVADHGPVLRPDAAQEFARRFALPTVSVADLVTWRRLIGVPQPDRAISFV